MRSARDADAKSPRRERRPHVEFAETADAKPSTRDMSEENAESSRRALERASVSDRRSETSSVGHRKADRRFIRSRSSDALSRSSENSDSEYTSHSGTETGSEFPNSEWSDVGPGAPFPETKQEREARLLLKLNASMATTMKYWDVEQGLGGGGVKPVPSFLVDEAVAFESKNASADTWRLPSDDEMSLGVNDGSVSGDSLDEVHANLGDFDSAHDLATPWNDRPRVIAKKIVRHIVNKALREALPPPRGFLDACFGCVAPRDPDRGRRSSRRR